VKDDLWQEIRVGESDYELLNLAHAEVDLRVMGDMENGVDVFYDCRWGITEVLSRWLEENAELIRDRKILILGAGVGMETLVLARHGSHVWVNDLAPVSLELCGEQLEKNGLKNFTKVVGRYEEIELPSVDLIIASFLIYNEETLASMQSFLASYQGELILVNERLDPFPKFLSQHEHRILFEEGDAVGVLLEKNC